MVNARAIDVAGEELKTVAFAGTMPQRENSAPKYARKPPLNAIIGKNQAMRVADNTTIPASLLFGTWNNEKRKRGPRKSRDEGRMPADIPRRMAAAKTRFPRPQRIRQHKSPTAAEKNA